MDKRAFRGFFTLVLAAGLAIVACSLGSNDGPPRNAAVVEAVANSSLEAWLSPTVDQFNGAELKTAEGSNVYVVPTFIDSGQAVAEIADGEINPSLWIPEEEVWVNILRDQGNGNFASDCESVATSPLVIAMWRSAAESLGWPGLPLGWLDIGSLAADPSAWAYYSGGEFGDSLRLGHTHPGLSGSGASTLLALVQAAQSKTDSVTIEDIEQPIVQASVSAFEAAVSWFSASTADLSQAMAQRGNQFLGAAVMYESDVVNSGIGELVPIYPLEGSFVATHPACLNSDSPYETREATQIFRDYLIGEEAQQLAVSSGLRPVNSNVVLGPPLTADFGVDLSEPKRLFSPPSVETVYSAQELWQSARKDVNLVMLLDVSGSMSGNKIENMRQAAIQFVEQMGDDDYLTIIAFSDSLPVIVEHQQVGPARDQIIAAIDNLNAAGDTALYDAVGVGALIIDETKSPDTTNALVVLTDGQDTYSYRYAFDQALMDLAAGNDTSVFTIAYGDDADRDVLTQLALGANGNFFVGDEASIAAIYQELSAAFGGSVGIGR
ncbi:MAG TPA: substrate-binding and VWA domain-containing protein [Patescibacteria group bacterium]|nr:substrate-binding and VWA domain-containing protein [Patescibacteria group bacterium]